MGSPAAVPKGTDAHRRRGPTAAGARAAYRCFMRPVLFVLAASVLLSACSPRVLRTHDELWNGAEGRPDAAAFMGYHGPMEGERPSLR